MMRLPRFVARLAAVPLLALSLGLSSPPTAASASGFCYAYNYSDYRAISHAAYEVISETVWYTMTFDCYGRALTVQVTHIHAYYGVSAGPTDHSIWHQAHSTQVNRQQYSDVAWNDNYGPGWYNAGSVQKDEYPNVTIPYNYYANTLTGLWMCGVQHADDCTFRHFFVAGYAQQY